MFFTRNDQPLLKRIKRRIKSARAAAFTEFSILAPILVLTISAMIELAAFWDSKVMATHAAWTIGRIAAVRAHESQSDRGEHTPHGLEFGERYDGGASGTNKVTVVDFAGPFEEAIENLNVKPKGFGDVTALYMMSTCGIDAFGLSGSASANDAKLKDIFTQQGSLIVDIAIGNITNALNAAIDEALPSFDGFSGGGKLMQWASQVIKSVVNRLFTVVLKPIFDLLKKILNKIADWVFQIDDELKEDRIWKRMAARMGSSAARLKSSDYKLSITVPKMDGSSHDGVWSQSKNNSRKFSRGFTFAYPQTARLETKRDDGWITEVESSPPNKQRQSVINVSLDWPFSGGWLFPVVSGLTKQGSAVTTHAQSITLAQPPIYPENLYSKGATEYQQGSTGESTDLSKLDIGDYIGMMWFSCCYRLRAETLGKGTRYRQSPGVWQCWEVTPLEQYLSHWDIGGTNIDAKCYRYTIRSLTTGVDKFGDVTAYYPPDGMEKSYGHKYYYFRSQQYTEVTDTWKHGYREFLFWRSWVGDESSVRHRYAGPVTCKDHLYVDNEPKGFGYKGKSSTIFFDLSDRALTEKLNPEDNGYGQFMRAVTAYEEPRYSALSSDRNAGAEISVDGSSDLGKLFKKTYRRNLWSAMQAFYPKSESESMLVTNSLMRYDAEKKTSALLRAQAVDFTLSMWENRVLLHDCIHGKSDDEIANDLVTQAGIDVYNNTENPLDDIEKWWESVKAFLDAKYELIDDGTQTLKADCSSYSNAVATLAKSLSSSSSVDNRAPDYGILDSELQRAYDELKNRNPQPQDEATLIDEVYKFLQKSVKKQYLYTRTEECSLFAKRKDAEAEVVRLSKTASPDCYYDIKNEVYQPLGRWITMYRVMKHTKIYEEKSVDNGVGANFRNSFTAMYNAYDKFRMDIVTQSTNEWVWTSTVTGEGSKYGGRELTPDDIMTDGNPEGPEAFSGGNPNVSGGDDYDFGDRWKFENGTWKSE